MEESINIEINEPNRGKEQIIITKKYKFNSWPNKKKKKKKKKKKILKKKKNKNFKKK